MEWYTVVILLVQCVCVSSHVNYFLKYGQHQDNFLTLDRDMRKIQRRNIYRTKRFLTFNNDESNIRVEIEFSVPFLEIPIGNKGSDGSLGGELSPMLSVNAKSAVVVTILFFVSYLLVPKLVHHFLPRVRERHQGRALEETEIERLVRGVESALHVNTTACWQQGVCSLVQSSRYNTSTAGFGKVLDGLSSMNWVESLTKGSALGEAFVFAKHDAHDGCNVFYSRCVLDSKNINSLPKELATHYMRQLMKLYYSRSKIKTSV